MAHYEMIYCRDCQKPKEMMCSDNPAHAFPKYCDECLVKRKESRRTGILEKLDSMTLAERVRKLEEKAYGL